MHENPGIGGDAAPCFPLPTPMGIGYASGVATRVGRLTPSLVENVTSYLVTFIRKLQNLYFIYPI